MEITTCLIGEDTLLIHCGNQLLARNFCITLVVSSLQSVQEWANENGLAWLANVEALGAIEALEVDYLFSIVNSKYLSRSIRNYARYYAINYHDSILPKYAGLNSTSWALVHNEKEHGVTWHIMDDEIDKGDIVYQKTLPVYPNDTALTLNLRCYENAITAFGEMLDLIETGKLTPKKQPLKERSYFASNQYLPCLGFVNWKLFSAETIERLSRALTLGQYNNAIGTLKLLIAKEFLIVSQVEIIHDYVSSKHEPGTVLSIDDHAVVVATPTRAIKITRLLSRDGEVILLREWLKTRTLAVGDILHSFEVKNEELLRKCHNSALRYESYWIKKIKGISEHHLFNLQGIKKRRKLEQSFRLKLWFPHKGSNTIEEILVTVIVIYLFRLNNLERVAVLLVHPHFDLLSTLYGPLFSTFLPLLFYKKTDFSLQEALDTVANYLSEIKKSPVFFSDIVARHPELKGNRIESGIVINLKGSKKDYPCPDNTVLYFNYDEQQNELEILHSMDLSLNHSFLKELLVNSKHYFVSIILHLINHPNVSARHFSFISQAERHKLLQEWGKGQLRYLSEQSLSALFEAQVANTPKGIAISMQNSNLTYEKLNELAEKVANYLRSKKLMPQTLVGLYLSRGFEMIAVILGILKANCVYVPLDTKYPLLKIEQILEDAKLTYLFIQQTDLDTFVQFFKPQKKDLQFLPVEGVLNAVQTCYDVPHDNTPIANKLAYVMYTTGTTGQPKGVLITHKNVINYCKWFIEMTHFDEESIIDFSSSIAFDLSVPCTLAPLLVGGSIAIATEAQKTNPLNYLTHLKKHKITHVELTPSYLEMLLNYPNEVTGLVDLRYLLLGADVVTLMNVKRWLALCPHHQVINEYGPTETTVSVVSYFVNKDELEEALVPIGRPAFNTSCYVLDKYKNLCPSGMKGELYISGNQVSKGYLNQEKLTRSQFISHDLSTSKELLYRTGDIVCWLPDGCLQFFGRNDLQVKIQGYRIELTAIESVLVKIPGILQAVVVVMRSKLKDDYLRAYLVTDKKPQTRNGIREFLGAYLPNYMIPREFCVIKSIPLKENEKIDFAALERQGYQLLRFNGQMASEDLTPEEFIIQRIWETIFHTVPSKHDDFFAMGGDSLMALQLISALKNHYNLDLPLQLVFEHPTIASLAMVMNSLSQPKAKKVSSLTKLNPLVKLASGKEDIPLFLVHPLGGSVFWYKNLAKHLEGKCTIYGIQDPSIDGAMFRFNSLEDMASYYLQEIRKVYSGNSYCLGGASFGSTVAFAMAQQLIASNKHLQFLGFFDGWAYYPNCLLAENTLNWLGQREGGLHEKEKARLQQLEEYRKSLLLTYQLSPLRTDITLFKARELWSAFASIDDRCNGWSPYIEGEIIRCTVPGNHESMFFDPHVKTLANHLCRFVYSLALEGEE